MNTATATAENPAAKVPHLNVRDTTATPEYPTRSHDMLVEGIRTPIIFEYGKDKSLPMDLALKFLKDPAFIVTDPESGERFDPNPHTPEAGEALELGHDEVVAKLSELTQESLLLRAMQLPGGEKFRKGTPKAAIVNFLVEHRSKAIVRSSADAQGVADGDGLSGAGTETVSGPMNKSALDRLFADVED